MKLSLLEILEATGGGEVGGTQVGETFSTFHTDSREVKSGGVFFALRGQEMDGAEFVNDAIARGAAAVVVERKTDIPTGIVEVLVPDTWSALYALASHALRRVQPLVVAVTGSNGKTSPRATSTPKPECRSQSSASRPTIPRSSSRWACSVRGTLGGWPAWRNR